MEIFIKFAYTGTISWDAVENLEELIKDADFLGIIDIKEEAIKVFASDLDPLKAIETYNLSEMWNSSFLKEKCIKTVLKNFELVCSTDEFLQLNIELFKEILSSNSFISCTETFLKGILEWTMKDVDLRKICLTDILTLIGFGLFNADLSEGLATCFKIFVL